MDAHENDACAFAGGAATSARSEPLSHALFSLRAGVLLGTQDASQGASWLSGLLIGAEWHDARIRDWTQAGEVRIVGDARLAARYESVARSLGIAVKMFEPESAFIAAAQHVWSHR